MRDILVKLSHIMLYWYIYHDVADLFNYGHSSYVTLCNPYPFNLMFQTCIGPYELKLTLKFS